MTVVTIDENNNNNKIAYSSYLFKFYDVWHDKLCHVNCNSMQMWINHELLKIMIFEKNHKCTICIESKFTKPSFQTIEKSSGPLDLIHSYIGNLKFVQMRGEKKYHITFIDNYTRYCYTYLFRSKDETLKMLKHYNNEVENKLNKKIKVI